MKKQAEEILMTFQASGMELVALGSAILRYSDYIQYSQQVSLEEREVELCLRRFYARLAEQLPPGKPGGSMR